LELLFLEAQLCELVWALCVSRGPLSCCSFITRIGLMRFVLLALADWLPAREIVSDQGESSLHQTAGLIHQTRSLMHQTKSRQIKVRNFFAQGWIGSVGNVPIRRSALRSSRITLKRGHHAASSVIQHHPASSNVFERQRPTSSNVIQRNPTSSSLFQGKKFFTRWTTRTPRPARFYQTNPCCKMHITSFGALN